MEKWRQRLHIEPPDGWLNDPNGLCFFKNKYHVFFQYSPNDSDGSSPRCWGHYSGESLVDLSFGGIALKPDILEDRSGVYSGSAIVSGDTLNLFYTGNVKEDGGYDYITSGREANVIRVTSKDGVSFGEKQVLLKNADYPNFCSCHVRDPKVWLDGESYCMVLGARTLEDRGCVLLYVSKNLTDWEYVTEISIPDFGYMWECPDFFKLDGEGYLSVSPQGLTSQITRFQNVYQSGYFKLLDRLEAARLGDFYEWDMGFDFYAPQTFEAPDGRRILIGWMGIGDVEYKIPTAPLGWQHCLTIPREIKKAPDGRLLQTPVKELDKLHGSKTKLCGKCAELKLPFDFIAEVQNGFSITLDNALMLKFDEALGVFTMSFSDSDVSGGRDIRRALIDSVRSIRIIADMSSVEVYLNGGECVLSTRFFPKSGSVRLEAAGELDAEIYGFDKDIYGGRI